MPCTHAAYLRAAAECRTPCDAVALAADPSLGLSYEALLSICAARLVAATKASMGRHRAKAAAITQRYEGGAHLVAIAEGVRAARDRVHLATVHAQRAAKLFAQRHVARGVVPVLVRRQDCDWPQRCPAVVVARQVRQSR